MTLFVYSYSSVGLGCNFVLFNGVVQFLTRFKPLQISKHEMSDFPKMILNVFQRNRVIGIRNVLP